MKLRRLASSGFHRTKRQSLELAGAEASAAVVATVAVVVIVAAVVGVRLSRLRQDDRLGTGSSLPRWVGSQLSGSELEFKTTSYLYPMLDLC